MRPIPGLRAVGRPLPEFLAANPHAFSRAELLGHWTRRALENAVRGGGARRVLPGVYAASVHSQAPIVRGEALNLWHPAGRVTGALALHLYADRLPAPATADLRVTNGTRPRAPAWLRCLQGERIRVSSAPSGVECTVPERALLDAWTLCDPDARRNLLWEAMWARVCTWRQLRRELDRTLRVAGRRDLERVLGWFADGATTPLEVRARHETFADARFRDFEWQVALALPSRRATVDMLHRRLGVVVELDGDRYHSTRSARDADRERQTDLAAAGYAVVRFGWTDLTKRPEWCRERLLAVVARRLARPGGT
ncbi:DUF559 domain-containing protein [Demequina sp.]|uniref:DUF559 domain-containing protein n=1 Tax=Demequina sp. TaxID=2050685 RepID=UPI0025E27F13|nr:DUF559 domain-containing protein [Demequina sp.]